MTSTRVDVATDSTNAAFAPATSAESPAAPARLYTDGDKGLITKFISKLPVIGPALELAIGLSPSGRRLSAVLLTIFVVYPIVALLAVLLLIRISPGFVQSGARSFVLASLGVDDEVQGTLQEMVRSVDDNNDYIDFTRALTFVTPNRSEYNEDVRVPQRVTFKSLVYYLKKVTHDPACLVTHEVPSPTAGTLSISVTGTDISETRFILSRAGERQIISQELGEAFWKRVRTHLGADVHDVTLRFNFEPNSEITSSTFGKCNDINMIISMTVFKPPLKGNKV